MIGGRVVPRACLASARLQVRRLWVVMVAALLAACSARHEGVLIPVADAEGGASRVQVLVATTRQRANKPGDMFNGDRSDRFPMLRWSYPFRPIT